MMFLVKLLAIWFLLSIFTVVFIWPHIIFEDRN